MKNLVENTKTTGLLKIDYTVPNYDDVKEEVNFNENAKWKIELIEKHSHTIGYRECNRRCGGIVKTWIFEEESMNRTYGHTCSECTKKINALEAQNKSKFEEYTGVKVLTTHDLSVEKIELEPSAQMYNSWYSKNEPIKVLSWGAGTDSSLLVLENWNEVDEIVMVDTGAEEIETYEYIKYFISKLPHWARNKITIIKNENLGDIDEWHFEKEMIPMPFTNRTCTDKFKLRVIHKYLRTKYGTEAVFDMWVGINYDEQLERERPLVNDEQLEFHIKEVLKYSTEDLVKNAKRAGVNIEDYKERLRNSLQSGSFKKDGSFRAGLQYARNVYPLCKHKIGKDDERAIFEERGIQLPPKSGCYFCPMKSKKEFARLEKEHPDQYENVLRLDANSKSRTISIIGMKEEKVTEMRCSCNNGIYEEDDEARALEAKLKEREGGS